MSKKLLLIVLVIVFSIISSVAGYYIYKKKNRVPYTPKKFYEIFQAEQTNQNYESAYAHLKRANELAPNNPTYAWELAKIEFAMKNYKRSHSLASLVWKQGQKNLKTLQTIVYSMQGDKKRNLKNALAYLEELPQSERVDLMRGEIFRLFDEPEKSKQAFMTLYQSNPNHETVYQLARSYLRNNENKKAMDLLESHKKNDSLNRTSLLILAQIYESFYQYDKVFAIYSEIDQMFSPSVRSEYEKGMMHFHLGNYPSSANILNQIKSSSLLNNADLNYPDEFIKMTLTSTKAQFVKLKNLLNPEEQQCLVDYNNQVSNRLNPFDIILNKLNKMIEDDQDNLRDWLDMIPHFKKTENQNSKETIREAISKLFPKYIRTNDLNFLAHKSRLRLALTYLIQNNIESINELLDYSKGDDPLLEGERYLYSLLKKASESNSDLTSEFSIAKSLLKNEPVVDFIYYMAQFRNRDYKKALNSLEAMAGKYPRFARSSTFSLEYINTLAQNGDIDQAISLLSKLHARKLISQPSLSLLRNLSYKKGLKDISWETQKILEENFKDDDAIKLQGSILALDIGKTEETNETLELLSKKYPDNVQIKMTKILSDSSKYSLNQVLKNIDKEELPSQVKHYLKSMLYSKNKLFDKAIPLLEGIIKDESDSILKVNLSRLYLANKNIQKAEQTIKSAIEDGIESEQVHILLGLAYLTQKKYDDALTVFKKAKVTYPKSWEIYLLESWSLYYLKLYKRALSNLDLVSIPKKDEASVLLLKGLSSFYLNELGDSKRYLTAFLATNKNEKDSVISLWHLANIHFAEKSYQKTIDALDKILEKYSKENSAISLKFKSLLNLNDENSALNFLNETKSNRSLLQFALDQSFYYESKKDYPKAMSVLEPLKNETVALYSWCRVGLLSNKEFQLPQAIFAKEIPGSNWAKLGVIACNQKNWVAADQGFERAVKLIPENPIILNNWAWTLLELNSDDKKKVLSLLEKANKLVPNNPDILDTYLKALERFKEFKMIVKVSQDHLFLFTEKSKALYLFGKAHEAESIMNEALRYYKNSIDLQKDKWELEITKSDLQEKIKHLEKNIKNKEK